jgi:Family of unknown function (DUF5681)
MTVDINAPDALFNNRELTGAYSEEFKGNIWKPGQSGNPAGRPKGARSKLGESFLVGMLVNAGEILQRLVGVKVQQGCNQ